MHFYDTYALIELIRENPNYNEFKIEFPTCTTLNLFELHFHIKRQHNKQTADYWINKFDYTLLEITKEDVIVASDFKLKHKDKSLSTVDCLGYAVAARNKLKFLTGDKDFEDIENVEYVK